MGLLAGLAGLGGAASAAGGYGEQENNKDWEAQKLKLIEERTIRSEGRANAQETMTHNRDRANDLSDYELEKEDKIAAAIAAENTPTAISTRNKTDAGTGLLNAQTENLKRGRTKNGKPIDSGREVKKVVTDQDTGENFTLYKDGSIEPMTITSTTPGRGIPFNEGYDPVTSTTPVYGEVKGVRDAGERDYLNAYNDYVDKFKGNMLNYGKEPISYTDYIQTVTEGGSSAPAPAPKASGNNDLVGKYLSR
jgi:hypothetical protein